jgi:hypothetical protein
VQLLGQGRTNKEVATVLDLSVKTVEAHRANIMRKLRLRSVTDLVRYAIATTSLLPPPMVPIGFFCFQQLGAASLSVRS